MLLQNEIHSLFIKNCTERIRPSEEILKSIKMILPEVAVCQEARKIMLCLKTLKEYVAESDNNYGEERALPPHCK